MTTNCVREEDKTEAKSRGTVDKAFRLIKKEDV